MALRIASRVAPSELQLSVFSGLGALPLFNPDFEGSPSAAVTEFKQTLDHADALIIASPEYAHGISGVLKNALDWLVSHEGFVNKPVAVFNTAPRSHHAIDALNEVLKTMSANVVKPACCTVPMLGSTLEENQMSSSEVIGLPLREALEALAEALRELRDRKSSG